MHLSNAKADLLSREVFSFTRGGVGLEMGVEVECPRLRLYDVGRVVPIGDIEDVLSTVIYQGIIWPITGRNFTRHRADLMNMLIKLVEAYPKHTVLRALDKAVEISADVQSTTPVSRSKFNEAQTAVALLRARLNSVF